MTVFVRDPADRPVAVIGGGTLGRRIAMMFATRGGLVRLYDPIAMVRQAASGYIASTLPQVVASRPGAVAGWVETTADLAAALEDVWLVVEAVPERVELKRTVFGELDRMAPVDAILASNSSSYPSRQFVDFVRSPERVVNMHFYMPPTQNAVDLMSDGRTERAVLDLLLRELPAYGVIPFEARAESTGFIFNRIWAAIKRESLAVVSDGVATPEEVDRMFEINTGAAVGTGPFHQMDAVGLDVVLDIENHYASENPHLPEGPRTLLRQYVATGRLGVKTGAGFFSYPTS